MPTGVERRPRSHRMKFCVQRGLGGATPGNQAERKITYSSNYAEKWIALMKQYVNTVELTAELLNTLIEKITVLRGMSA